MISERVGGLTRAELEAVLDNLKSEDNIAVNFATRLFDAKAVTLVETAGCTKPHDIVGYHVEDNERARVLLSEGALANVCPVVNGTFALRNGVVVKKGHDDLKCSCPNCFYSICPLGLAACFEGLDKLGSSVIPLYSEAIDVTQATSRFRRTWADRLVESERAINLLLSRTENDFSGVLVVEDTSFLDGFVNDLVGTLAKMGKIDEDGVERMHIANLLRSVNTVDATFHSTQDENLKPRRLYVCDRLQDFFDRDTEHDFASRYLIERFGHIVDHRYLLLVGTREEIARFIGMSPTLELLLGANRIELAGLSANDLFILYRGQLEERVASQIDDDFRSYFVRYVDFNRDILPFHGIELAEYLAKHSNAKGSLSLPPSRYLSVSLDEMLEQIVGLDQVKRTIRELETFALFSKQARGRGKAMPSSSMHMVFMGNPGTGKTTVARIIATMLYKIGIISQNKCVEVTSKDLIARYVGHTDKQVYDVVQKARGGVLFIDEAYALAPDDHSTTSFGREALAELVKLMEDYRDDLIVILAGYEREMADFLDVNTGLSSRIGYTFHFQDFTTDQLVEIFHREMDKAGFSAAEGVDDELRQLFDYFRNFKSFGNGRFAREVLQKAVIAHATRLSGQDLPFADGGFVVAVEDIPSRRDMLDSLNSDERAAAEMLEPLVGLEDVKKKVLELERVVTYREQARRQGMVLPHFNLHMLFTGNPGTGKTTIARIIGKVLFNIGAVPTDRFVEIEAKDLTNRYVGGTGEETGKIIERSLGGVLFIDEAYALLDTTAGTEALAVLVKAMEDHKGELVVMFAGYEAQMRAFVDANPGLASRIGYQFRFEDYKPEELRDMFVRKMETAGFQLGEGVVERALALARYFHNVENFGNGRFVDRIIQETIAGRANRATGDVREVLVEDMPTIEAMCKLVASTVFDPSDVSGDEALRRVASHEVGHALVSLEETGKTDIVTITIEQEGTGALGYVQHERAGGPLPTAADLKARLAVLMAGMAAEQMVYGAYSAGNSSDLEQATSLARAYVASYGMSEAGFVQYVRPGASGATALADLPDEVRNQMKDLMAGAFERAGELLAANRDTFNRLVAFVLEKGTASGEELVAAWKGDSEPVEAVGEAGEEDAR